VGIAHQTSLISFVKGGQCPPYNITSFISEPQNIDYSTGQLARSMARVRAAGRGPFFSAVAIAEQRLKKLVAHLVHGVFFGHEIAARSNPLDDLQCQGLRIHFKAALHAYYKWDTDFHGFTQIFVFLNRDSKAISQIVKI